MGFEKGNSLWRLARKGRPDSPLTVIENKPVKSVSQSVPPVPVKTDSQGNHIVTMTLKIPEQPYRYIRTISAGRGVSLEQTIADGITYLAENALL